MPAPITTQRRDAAEAIKPTVGRSREPRKAAGGFYLAADEAADGQSLRRIGSDLGAHLGTPAPLEFRGWREVADAVLALGRDGTVPVVIDEFPYLARANPSLPCGSAASAASGEGR